MSHRPYPDRDRALRVIGRRQVERVLGALRRSEPPRPGWAAESLASFWAGVQRGVRDEEAPS